MTPNTILLTSVILGERGRTVYAGIPELAESIRDNGLIQPIVVERVGDFFALRAGGRRYHALLHLGITTLHHGISSDPLRPGYLLADVASDLLRGLMIEIAENHNRADMDWRDDVRLILKAWDIWERDMHAHGEKALRAEFAALMGVQVMNMHWAILLRDALEADPERFADCNTTWTAYQKMVREKANDIAKLAAERSLATAPAFVKGAEAPATPCEPQPDGDGPPPVVIPLTSFIKNGCGLEFMRSLPSASIDHVICDPDYAVDVATLEAGASRSAEGIVQACVEDSLRDLRLFIHEAHRVSRHFCIFWYDLNHHEKLREIARDAGWDLGNNTPLIWRKTGAPGNAAPNHNFPKTTEYAMVLRHTNTTLARVQSSNVYSCDRQRGAHPFTKPSELWQWIYAAVAIKGQTVLDPFAGKGSAPCAAIEAGLKPVAAEIQPVHYNDLVLNMQAAYRKAIGVNIRFT